KNFSAALIETDHTFAPIDDSSLKRVRRIICASRELPVHHIDFSLGHRRTGVARADDRAPKDSRSTGGKFFDDAGFTPNRIAFRAKPLRPILREQGTCKKPETNSQKK